VVESHQPDHAARCALQCLLALQSGPSPPLAVSDKTCTTIARL
jgi:hypothetical protein